MKSRAQARTTTTTSTLHRLPPTATSSSDTCLHSSSELVQEDALTCCVAIPRFVGSRCTSAVHSPARPRFGRHGAHPSLTSTASHHAPPTPVTIQQRAKSRTTHCNGREGKSPSPSPSPCHSLPPSLPRPAAHMIDKPSAVLLPRANGGAVPCLPVPMPWYPQSPVLARFTGMPCS